MPAGQILPCARSRNGSSCSFSYEVQSVIKVLEIHRQLCQVYGPNIRSKQKVVSVHDEERDRPSSMMILLSFWGSA
ncbi:hypothetical protein TNCV_2764721 [Trichonephila clavipes]|nr:hypothetical protein TNCV_2764721 [Trichonephila clavipes]